MFVTQCPRCNSYQTVYVGKQDMQSYAHQWCRTCNYMQVDWVMAEWDYRNISWKEALDIARVLGVATGRKRRLRILDVSSYRIEEATNVR